MAQVRVVIDLDLQAGRPSYRELAYFLVQAVENFQTAHGDIAVQVTSVRVPDEGQTLRQARELYVEEAFRRWQVKRSPP